MPTNIIEYTNASQERALEAIRESQKVYVEAVESWAKSLGSIVPDAAQPTLPEGIPTAEEVLETSFDFVSELLDVQRDFARKLIDASRPSPAPTAKAKAPAKSDS